MNNRFFSLMIIMMIMTFFFVSTSAKVNAAPVIGYVVESAGGEQLGVTKEEYKFQKGVEAAQVFVEGTKVQAVTNVLGWFWLTDLPDGVYNIAAVKEGYYPITKQVKVEGRQPASIMIVLTRKKIPPAISSGYSAKEITIPNAVYVGFAAVSAPGSSTAPAGSMPIPGSNMTSLQYKGAIAAGADPNSLTGFPTPNMDYYSGGPNDFVTPVNAHPNCVAAYDPNSPKDVKFINLKAKPYWLCFDTNGSKLFVSSDSQYLMVIDVVNGNKVIGSIPTGGIVTDMNRGPDGNIYVAVSSTNPGILVISPTTNAALNYYRVKATRIGQEAQPRGVVCGTNYIYVSMATANAGEVLAISKVGGTIAGSSEVGQFPQGLALTPNGQLLFVANYNGSDISVLDASRLAHLGKIRVGVQPMRLVCNSAGDKVYVTNRGSNYVSVIDVRQGCVVATVNTGKSPMGIGINSTGSRVFVANNAEGNITVINAEINTAIQTTTPSASSRPFGIAVRP